MASIWYGHFKQTMLVNNTYELTLMAGLIISRQLFSKTFNIKGLPNVTSVAIKQVNDNYTLNKKDGAVTSSFYKVILGVTACLHSCVLD